jgi:hypothetical protein
VLVWPWWFQGSARTSARQHVTFGAPATLVEGVVVADGKAVVPDR